VAENRPDFKRRRLPLANTEGDLHFKGGKGMNKDYLPAVYVQFRERFPGITDKVDALGTVADDAGPLDERTRRLVKLGIAVGAMAEGAVRSNVRKAL
jgi:alkylhydroperoxidase/carboxymuconolactone decarboxylase family protein YurZ